MRVLRDLWRLPKDGLARRFGPEIVDYSERLLGRLPDPQYAHQITEPFDLAYEFPYEFPNEARSILVAAKNLTRQLVDYLHLHDLSINRCRYGLYSVKQLLVTFDIGVRTPTRDAVHLLKLLEEQLGRTRLPEPVRRIRLFVEHYQAFETCSADLWVDSHSNNKANVPEKLFEQLQARLGREAIVGLAIVDDHRPEHAFQFTAIEVQTYSILRKQRPVWLLHQPKLLLLKQGHPWWKGPISIVAGPERIESGWWCGGDIRRDYYIGADHHGGRLWLYRDLCHPHGWYLHGLFA